MKEGDTLKGPEEMAHFFNQRASTYNEHMRESIDSFTDFYQSIASPIEKSNRQIEVLLLGCGTGIEMEYIFEQAPLASITGIDIAEKMLSLLKERYREYREQIQVIESSYLSYPFEEKTYDYCIGVMTMHHLRAEKRLELYRRIRESLKSGGQYIEGDYVVSKEKEREYLKTYFEKRRGEERDDYYHEKIRRGNPRLFTSTKLRLCNHIR